MKAKRLIGYRVTYDIDNDGAIVTHRTHVMILDDARNIAKFRRGIGCKNVKILSVWR